MSQTNSKRECPTCGAPRPASGDWLEIECRATGATRVACSDRRGRFVRAQAEASDEAPPILRTMPARKPRSEVHRTRPLDVFDEMNLQALRAKPHAPAPFSAAQIRAGREYRHLVEACTAGGTRGSWSSERVDRSAGALGILNGVEGDVARSAHLQRMQDAIGRDVVLQARTATVARRVSGKTRSVPMPGAPVEGGRPITARDLVYAVCVQEWTISKLLQEYGWGQRGERLQKVRASLCAALNRLSAL